MRGMPVRFPSWLQRASSSRRVSSSPVPIRSRLAERCNADIRERRSAVLDENAETTSASGQCQLGNREATVDVELDVRAEGNQSKLVPTVRAGREMVRLQDAPAAP